MKITKLSDDANGIADIIRVAHSVRQHIDGEGYSLAVIEAVNGEEQPHVVLVAEADIDTGPPYVAVSVTDPPKLFHLAGDLDPDGDPVRDNLGCGVADPDADAVADRCHGEEGCGYEEPHRHGFACNWRCICKPARTHSTSNDPGSRLGGSRSASEPSSAPADHPGPSEAAEAAPTASLSEEAVVRLRDLLRRGGR